MTSLLNNSDLLLETPLANYYLIQFNKIDNIWEFV